MSELWVPDKYRAEVAKDVKPFFAPVAGAPAFAPAVQSAQAEIARQGAISSNPFAPGLPLQPYEGVGGVPRGWDFPTGYNIKARADRDGRLSFETLKKLTDTYEVARLCIQHRIDDVRSLDWTVVPAEGTDRNMGDVIALAKRYLKKPDGRTPFRNWLAMYLEDVLRYDAGVLSKRRNRAGRVIGLDVVQGSTIAPVVDYWGRPPTGDAPAFVQFVNGLPWKWFTSDQLIYAPFRPQPDSMYGFAPIEGAMMSANTHLRFQQHWLEWFTQGTIPDGFGILPENVGTTSDDRDRWQKAWDALYAGDSAMKSQIKWMPFGTSFEWPKDHTFDEAFPTFLMRIVCAVYSVTPNDIGFTMDVNRANGETQVDVQFRVGTRPLLKHIEDILTDWLQDDMGLPVVFQFDEGGEKEDREATAKAWEIGIRNGAVSPDEMRVDVFGKEVDDSRPTPRYIYTNTQGPIPLRSLLDVAGPVDPDTTAPSEEEPLGTEAFAGTPGVLPHKSPGSPQFARAPIDPDDPAHPSNEGVVPGSGVVAQPAPTGPEQSVQKAVDEPIEGVIVEAAYDLTQDELRALSTWRHSARSSVKLGKLPRKFKDSGLPDHVEAEVWKGLRGARTREQVDGAFAPVITKAAGDSPDPKGWRADPPSPEPQHALDLSLTDYYRPEVQQGLEGLWTDAQLEHGLASIVGSGSAERAILNALVGMHFGASMNTDDLQNAMETMWRDAYRSGQLAAGKQLGMVSQSEWDSWKPGFKDTEAVSGNGGLRAALADAGVTIKGIQGESLRLLATQIEHGVASGSTVDQIARSIRGAVGSADRAEMIAHTESARLLTRASLDQYVQAGVTEWDLVISAGACPKCVNIASANPHPIGDTRATAPVHPYCRCAVSPAKIDRGAPPSMGAGAVSPASWIPTGLGESAAPSFTFASTAHLTDAELGDLYVEHGDDPAAAAQIEAIFEERDRRGTTPGGTALDPFEVDRAKAAVSGFTLDDPILNPASRPERRLTPDQRVREEYEAYAMTQYSRALDDTNGVLLNRAGMAKARATGADLEMDVFMGPWQVANKYASEELQQWWRENGRETLASFRYASLGRSSDRSAAERVISRGHSASLAGADRSAL